MDESSMIQLPMELFDHLDNPAANNPELYQVKMIEDAESRALGLKKKFSDLEVSRQSYGFRFLFLTWSQHIIACKEQRLYYIAINTI